MEIYLILTIKPVETHCHKGVVSLLLKYSVLNKLRTVHRNYDLSYFSKSFHKKKLFSNKMAL